MSLIESGTLSDLPYAILMNDHLGTLCGYLGVPPGHPWYGHHSDWADDSEVLNEVSVHGGLTWVNASYYGHQAEVLWLKRKMQEGIKHSLEEGEPEDELGHNVVRSGRAMSTAMVRHYERQLDYEIEHAGEKHDFPIEVEADVWWVGFDCGHYMDGHSPEWLAQLDNAHRAIFSPDHGTFKDRDYVFRELQSLAEQAYLAAQADSAHTGDRTQA